MRFYYKRSTIEEMDGSQLKKVHKLYVSVIISILLIGGIVSLLSIWEYIPSMWRYTMLICIGILWPWIMQSSHMAKQLSKESKDK